MSSDSAVLADLPSDRTEWLAITLLYLVGCTTALHIGKIPVAIPLIREQWQLSLTQTGLIVSLYSILIAISGLLLGLLIRRRYLFLQ